MKQNEKSELYKGRVRKYCTRFKSHNKHYESIHVKSTSNMARVYMICKENHKSFLNLTQIFLKVKAEASSGKTALLCRDQLISSG